MSFHILYQEGYKPKERARDSLKAFLEAYLRKPDGIGIRLKKIPDSGQTDYSTKDLNELIDENRPFPRIGTDRIHAFMVVVNGSYSEDGGGATTLGLAFAANRMALFGGAVEEYSDDPTEPQPWKLEASVMSHEMGHNLGLVANGSPMVNEHRDEDHGSHCDNSDCLMYYTAETSDIVNSLVGNKVPTLDAACQNDLEANGGS
ncbi:MAG: zinc-dependent metalloprotease family protein [Flavobacteriales bacterium]